MNYQRAVEVVKYNLKVGMELQDFLNPCYLLTEVLEDKRSEVPHCFIYDIGKNNPLHYLVVKRIRLIKLAKQVNLGLSTIARILDKAGMPLERVTPTEKLTIEQHMFIKKCVSNNSNYKRYNDFLKEVYP